MPDIRFDEFVQKCKSWKNVRQMRGHVVLVIGNEGTQDLFGHQTFDDLYATICPDRPGTIQPNATRFSTAWGRLTACEQRDMYFKQFTKPNAPQHAAIDCLVRLVAEGYFGTIILCDPHRQIKAVIDAADLRIEVVSAWEIVAAGIEYRLSKERGPTFLEMGDLLYKWLDPTSHYTGADSSVISCVHECLQTEANTFIFWGWSSVNIDHSFIARKNGKQVYCLGEQEVTGHPFQVVMPNGNKDCTPAIFCQLAEALQIPKPSPRPVASDPAVAPGKQAEAAEDAECARAATDAQVRRSAFRAAVLPPVLLAPAYFEQIFAVEAQSRRNPSLTLIGMAGVGSQTQWLAARLVDEIAQRNASRQIHLSEVSKPGEAANVIEAWLVGRDQTVVVSILGHAPIDANDLDDAANSLTNMRDRRADGSKLEPFSGVIVAPILALEEFLNSPLSRSVIDWHLVTFPASQILEPQNIQGWLRSNEIVQVALATGRQQVEAILETTSERLINAVFDIVPSPGSMSATNPQVDTAHRIAELWMLRVAMCFRDYRSDEATFVCQMLGPMLEHAIQTVRERSGVRFSLNPVKVRPAAEPGGPPPEQTAPPPDQPGPPPDDFDLTPRRKP